MPRCGDGDSCLPTVGFHFFSPKPEDVLMNKIYSMITERICKMLEAGTIPWQHPWTTPGIFPQNMMSRHQYRGINAFLLAYAGFQLPFFLTFKQTKSLGGHVKRGEKGFPIVFWKFREVEKEDSQSGETETVNIPMSRFYTVFNCSQIAGIDDKIPALEKPNGNYSPIEKAEQLIANMLNPPKIQHQKRQAYYNHQTDIINIPAPEWFESSEHYYATLFHELIHYTGHHSRLKRRDKDEKRTFGSDAYSKEELIAEMGSAFLCALVGIEKPVIRNAAAYIQGWLEVFEDDNTMLITAAGKAQKAVEWVLKR